MIDFTNFSVSDGFNLIMGIMVKALMICLSLLALILVRQDQLMAKVVDIPFGGKFKLIVWSFFLLTLGLTAIVIVLA